MSAFPAHRFLDDEGQFIEIEIPGHRDFPPNRCMRIFQGDSEIQCIVGGDRVTLLFFIPFFCSMDFNMSQNPPAPSTMDEPAVLTAWQYYTVLHEVKIFTRVDRYLVKSGSWTDLHQLFDQAAFVGFHFLRDLRHEIVIVDI